MEDQMTRTILTLALMLAASSAFALERSPDGRGHIGGERSATSDRGLSGGNRERSGDRERSFAAGGGKSYPQRDRSGRAGDRD